MNAQKPSRELTIGEAFSWTFSLYSRHFAILWIPILVASLITGVIGAAIAYYGFVVPQPPIDITSPEALSQYFTYITNIMLLAVVLAVLSVLIGALAQGIVIKSASDLIERGSTELQGALSFALRKVFSIIIGSLISGILIILGTFFLIIPGIILAIIFSLVIPTIIIENIGALNSLDRSRRLVSGRWLNTFLFFFVIGLVLFAAAFIVILIVTPIGGLAVTISLQGFEFWSILLGTVIEVVILSAIAPIVPIAMTVYYYSMLAREQLAFQLPPPPPTL